MNYLHEGDFKEWADYSFKVAKTKAYPGVVVNEPLSDEYVAQAV